MQLTIDKIQVVQNNMKAAQDRQKNYVDHRHRALGFEVREKVFLKISP